MAAYTPGQHADAPLPGVFGDYQLSAYVYSFRNPGHKCAVCLDTDSPDEEPGCCDDFAIKDECTSFRGCELLLKSCARPLNTSASDLQCPGLVVTVPGGSELNTDEQTFNPRHLVGTVIDQKWVC